MFRLYFDEDTMRHALVVALRARGVDALTTLEAGMIERSDEENLEFATSQGCVLYSFNVAHFYRLHTAWLVGGRSHAGLILCQQQQYSIGEQMRRLLKIVAARSAEQMVNQVEFLSAWS